MHMHVWQVLCVPAGVVCEFMRWPAAPGVAAEGLTRAWTAHFYFRACWSLAELLLQGQPAQQTPLHVHSSVGVVSSAAWHSWQLAADPCVGVLDACSSKSVL